MLAVHVGQQCAGLLEQRRAHWLIVEEGARRPAAP